MIGNSSILNARMNGYAPEHVWIHVLDIMPTYWMKQDAQDCIANGFRAQILILPNEAISSLDLTALFGLTAHIVGNNEARCRAVINQCQKYASRVIYCTETSFTDWSPEHAAA